MSVEVVSRKQVEGVCDEISEKGDWTTFNINVGTQYPLRLSTKLEAVIKIAREAKGQKAIWSFTESQGGENPNKPGTHYINRRLEKVEVGGALDPTQAQSSGGSGGLSRSPDERRSIERQTIVKAAVRIYDQFADEDLFFSFLEKLAEFVAGAPATAAAKAASGDPGPTQPASEFPQDDSDDIPFAWIDNYEATGMGMLPRFYMS